MKKLIIVLSAAVFMVACNNNGDASENIEDSVTEKIDSMGQAREDSVERATDSLKETVENSFEKTDSANAALADSANKR